MVKTPERTKFGGSHRKWTLAFEGCRMGACSSAVSSIAPSKALSKRLEQSSYEFFLLDRRQLISLSHRYHQHNMVADTPGTRTSPRCLAHHRLRM